MKHPFRGYLDIKRSELALVGAMFGYFFLVITTFWILKPLKKTAFIGYYKTHGGFTLFGGEPLAGSQAELLAKVMNMVVAFFAALAFSALAKKLRREQLTWVFAAFTVLALASFALAGEGGEVGVWLFYLFGDLFNTLMVATFFAFLNDSFSPSEARRAYGPIVLGGVCGGAFGSLFLAANVNRLSVNSWLFVSIGLTVLVALIAAFAGDRVRRREVPSAAEELPAAAEDEPRASLFEGVRLVARSRYLLAIVAMVALYEIISTVIDFQFTATIESGVPVAEQRGVFATVYAVTNGCAMALQLFVTSAILQRFGIHGALLVMPAALTLVATGYLALPVVLVGCLLSGVDNGLSYSLNQSAREALYTVTTRREKYQAKAMIDMFVQRFAKALAVGLSLLLTLLFADPAMLRWLSIIPIAGGIGWFALSRYAGRQFVARERERDRVKEVSP